MEKDFAQGSTLRLFSKFAIPSVVSLLFMGIQTIIDGLVLGNFVGANALASVSIVLPAYSLISALSIVIGVGCMTMMSISLGEQNLYKARCALRSAMIFIVGMMAFCGIVLYIFAPELVALLGANDVLMHDSVNYMRALAPFIPMIALMFLCDSILDTEGRTVYSMAVMMSTVVINALLDLLFIAEFGWGTTGAGLATGIAFTCGMAAMLPFVLRRGGKLDIYKGHFSWRIVGRMLYNGSSEGVAELSAGINILIFNITMMHYLGEVGVSAFTALEYILFVGITIFLGVSNGIIPLLSYSFGAGKRERMLSFLKLAAGTNLVIGAMLCLTMILFGGNLVSLFFSENDTQAIALAAHGSAIYAAAFLFNGLNILASSYFTAMGNAKVSIIISLMRGLVVLAPLVILLPMVLGIEGIWLAIPIAEVLTFIVSVILVTRSLRVR